MLTKKQFDILTALEADAKLTQRALAQKTGMSLGTANKTLGERPWIYKGRRADGKRPRST